MKRFLWLVVAMVMGIAGIASVYAIQSHLYSAQASQVEALWERQRLAENLILKMENYRRQSAGFRHLTESGVAAAKSAIKSEVTQTTDRLEQLDPTPEDNALALELNQQIADFFTLSAKLEPMLFLRDAYQKPEAQKAHEAILKTIKSLETGAESRQKSIQASFRSKISKLNTFVIALAAGSIAMGLLLLLSVLTAFSKPLQALVARAREVRAGKLRRETPSRLKSIHAEIESTVDDLASMADSQRRETQNFVMAVANDLRAPIVPLQTSAALLTSVGSQLNAEQKADAAEVVRRSVLRLSRTLDDLTDTLWLENSDIKLDEKIVDLREVVQDVAGLLSGPGSSHRIRIHGPALPIWAFIDGKRLERVMINLITKMIQYSPQGGEIEISLSRNARANSGVEIGIHEAVGDKPGAFRATGPEQDLLRHWISENGFGMALSKRMVEAHGGSIAAAGVAGTSVAFMIRLPEDRLANAAAPRPGIKTLISERLATHKHSSESIQ